MLHAGALTSGSTVDAFRGDYADKALENNAFDRMALKHLDHGFNYSKQLDNIFTFFLLE